MLEHDDHDHDPLAYDFASAKRVATLLRDEDIPAVVEEFDVGLAHIRIDPEDQDDNGWFAIATDDDDNTGWVMVQTTYHPDLHTYEADDDIDPEPLGLDLDTDAEIVADSITTFIN